MRLARLPLAALTVLALAACTSDATAPDLRTPSGPVMNGTYFGSGLKAGSDSTTTSSEFTISGTELP